jgi:hypothetical protein
MLQRLRRMLVRKPSMSEQYERFGRELAAAFVEGLRDPRPLTAEEWAELDAYTGAVARRSFSALYDDED